MVFAIIFGAQFFHQRRTIMQKTYQIANIVGYLGVLVTNFLANALPIAGRTTGDVADQYPNLFTPAGITFSIWGVIYLSLLVFVVLQSRGLFRERVAPEYLESIGPWFFLSCLCNVGWILVWHQLWVVPSMILMLGLLYTLLVIYQRLDGYAWRGFGWIRLPFSLYLAWICVATLANTTVLLVDLGYSGQPLSAGVWTAILVGLASVLGLFFLYRRNDPVFPLVIVWALIGIIVKLRASFDWDFSPIIAASIGIALLVFSDLWRVFRFFRQRV